MASSGLASPKCLMISVIVLSVDVLIVRTERQVNLRGYGASFPNTVYQTWITHFKVRRSSFVKLNMTYEPTGSGTGKARFRINVPPAEFIGTDSRLKDVDYAANPDAQMFPTMAGPLAIGFRVPGVAYLNLTRSCLVKIYSAQITMWNDPELQEANRAVQLPVQKIMVITRRSKSGSTSVLTEALSSFSSAWKQTYGAFDQTLDADGNVINWHPDVITYLAGSTSAVSGLLVSIDYTMGYLNLNEAITDKISYFHVETRKPGHFVSPTMESVQSAMEHLVSNFDERFQVLLVDPPGEEDYPLAMYTYMVVKLSHMKDCNSAEELYRYIEWILSNDLAREDVMTLNFVPLSKTVADRVRENVLEKMTCEGNSVKAAVLARIRDENVTLQTWRLPVFIATPVGIFLVVIMFALIGYQQFRMNRALIKGEWKIPMKKIMLNAKKMGSMGSQRSLATRSRNTLQSGNISRPSTENSALDSAFRFNNVEVGKYKGETVCLRETHLPSNSKPSLKLRRDFLWLKSNIVHANIARFFGVADFKAKFWVVGEFWHRILQDVLQNERFNLDDNFKFSISCDVADGMKYLHSCGIVHGNLSSAACCIDVKWTVKIMDWSFFRIASISREPLNFRPVLDKDLVQDANMVAKGLLWTAPELLKDEKSFPTKVSDGYSFGVILLEIFTRDDPFSELSSKYTAQEIIMRVMEKNLRPKIPTDYPLTIKSLTESLLSNDTEERPSFREISRRIKESKPSKKGVLDCMMEAMEQYMAELEDRVTERTGELDIAMKNMENLLHQMLPAAIATKLMKGEQIDAETYDDVTIFFSDIVGFTSLSAGSGPMDIVKLLNDLYTAFDAVLDQHDVYKVETIGDAYMVGSGLPKRNGIEHAGHVATMSLALAVAASKFVIHHKPEESLNLRAGIHTGPCAAGVVGIKMPRYCLFGDTVNTASRMESTSMMMKIQISETTVNRLNRLGGYVFVKRGSVAVKGKGNMETYWLHGKQGFPDPVPLAFQREISEPT